MVIDCTQHLLCTVGHVSSFWMDYMSLILQLQLLQHLLISKSLFFHLYIFTQSLQLKIFVEDSSGSSIHPSCRWFYSYISYRSCRWFYSYNTFSKPTFFSFCTFSQSLYNWRYLWQTVVAGRPSIHHVADFTATAATGWRPTAAAGPLSTDTVPYGSEILLCTMDWKPKLVRYCTTLVRIWRLPLHSMANWRNWSLFLHNALYSKRHLWLVRHSTP